MKCKHNVTITEGMNILQLDHMAIEYDTPMDNQLSEVSGIHLKEHMEETS
jgi:hypothetical protein